jgi:hypothetical protein
MPESAGRFAEADAELARLVAREAHEEAQRQEALAAAQHKAESEAAHAVQEVTAQRTDAAIAAVTEQAAQAVEPVLTDAPLAASIPPAPSVERRGHLDALIDAIAPITVAQIVPGEVALQAQPSTRRAGNKPFAIEGMNQDSKQWEPLQTGQRYLGFQAGVQLANRTGALNEIEFSEFVTKVQRFADALGAMADVPNMLNEVSRARELDQFASEHDAQLSFMLRARQASWSAGYVQQNAQRLGFVITPMPGRMVLASPIQGLPPVLVLNYDPRPPWAMIWISPSCANSCSAWMWPRCRVDSSRLRACVRWRSNCARPWMACSATRTAICCRSRRWTRFSMTWSCSTTSSTAQSCRPAHFSPEGFSAKTNRANNVGLFYPRP